MKEQVYFYHFNETAIKNGYEVRIANSWNAYDWLSQETTAKITKTMPISKVDEPIHSVLKMALLMENGGVLVNQFDTVFLGSLDWIEEMFENIG